MERSWLVRAIEEKPAVFFFLGIEVQLERGREKRQCSKRCSIESGETRTKRERTPYEASAADASSRARPDLPSET